MERELISVSIQKYLIICNNGFWVAGGRLRLYSTPGKNNLEASFVDFKFLW